MKNFRRAVASLVLVFVAIQAQADWTSAQKEFGQAKSRDEAIAHLKESDLSAKEDLLVCLEDYESATTKAAKDSTFESIKQYLAAHALSEHFQVAKGSEVTAKAIKTDPIYKAEKEAKSANWLQKLFERLKMPDSSSPSTPDIPKIPGWVGNVVQVLFYLLCGALIVGLIYLLTKIPWAWSRNARAKKSKRGGMLEDGEQLLSEDEYLLEASRLIAEGRFREACRALFLASLLRIDKARIARFEPAQTNWEHLRRIESSKTRPELLDFRPTTKAYDMAWYGYRAKSAADVEIFRETYITIKNLTEGTK